MENTEIQRFCNEFFKIDVDEFKKRSGSWIFPTEYSKYLKPKCSVEEILEKYVPIELHIPFSDIHNIKTTGNNIYTKIYTTTVITEPFLLPSKFDLFFGLIFQENPKPVTLNFGHDQSSVLLPDGKEITGFCFPTKDASIEFASYPVHLTLIFGDVNMFYKEGFTQPYSTKLGEQIAEISSQGIILSDFPKEKRWISRVWNKIVSFIRNCFN